MTNYLDNNDLKKLYEDYSKVLIDYGYDSIEHFLYDFAKYYKISFKSALDRQETILKLNTDMNTMLAISENISDTMVVSLEEFTKIQHCKFDGSELEITICENKHKMKAFVYGNYENNSLVHTIYVNDKIIYTWKDTLDVSSDKLKELIENSLKF